MLDKMSDAQQSMLLAAVAREDRLLQSPANVRGASAKTLLGKLVDSGWIKEIEARSSAPVWRRDGATGKAYALKLTAKGLKAVGAATKAARGKGTSPVAAAKTGTRARARQSALLAPVLAATAAAHSHGEVSPTATRTPRVNSKLGRVLGMLSADAGATIGELTKATGWLEHTTRAALTGLRHRGYALKLTKQERDGASVYRIAGRDAEAAQ